LTATRCLYRDWADRAFSPKCRARPRATAVAQRAVLAISHWRSAALARGWRRGLNLVAMSEQSSLAAAIDAVIRERGEEPEDQVDDGSTVVVDFVFSPPQPPSAEEIAEGSTARG